MSSLHHPTAVIHPAARLGAEVRVGPYAVIEAGAELGDGCIVEAHAFVGSFVRMGTGNIVGHGAILGADPQDLAFRPEVSSHVQIGSRNRFREHCTVHRGTADGSVTTIGDDCYLMAGAHVGHNCALSDRVILANNVLLGGHVHVGERVFLGGATVVHQHVRIGYLAISQGMSGIGKDVPPYAMAAEICGLGGLNVIGMRRAGLTAAQRAEVKRAFDLLYREGRNTSQALEAASAQEWGAEGQRFWEFVRGAKKRGLCDLIATRPGRAGASSEE